MAAKQKRTAASAAGISLASSEPVLFYTGGPIYGDAPARDLTAGDLAYLHRVGALRRSGGEPVGKATPAALEELAGQLAATGAFSPQPPKPEGDDPTAPADPAEEN